MNATHYILFSFFYKEFIPVTCTTIDSGSFNLTKVIPVLQGISVSKVSSEEGPYLVVL